MIVIECAYCNNKTTSAPLYDSNGSVNVHTVQILHCTIIVCVHHSVLQSIHW